MKNEEQKLFYNLNVRMTRQKGDIFKKVAEQQHRTASMLARLLIDNYIKENFYIINNNDNNNKM